MLTLDLSALPPGVEAELRKGRVAKDVLTLNKAAGLQAAIARNAPREVRAMDGVGALKANICSTAYHYWGRRLGYACWSDAQFVREFLRDNPAARVKSSGTRTQVGYTGSLTIAGKYTQV